jgi:two-component system, OmpR family, sensor histidine kinase KdpD
VPRVLDSGVVAEGSRTSGKRAFRAFRRRISDDGAIPETLSRVAHELRNPLASIKGLATTGAEHYASMSDEERVEFFRLIDAEANRLGRLVDQAATAMRLSVGAIRYDRTIEDLGELTRSVIARYPYGQHSVQIDTEEGVSAAVDTIRLRESFENVLDNAARYSPPDAPISVRVGRDEEGAAVIEVADRGPGVPVAFHQEIFTMFSSWRPAGYEETPGAGLGLFITRSFVEAMGGRVALEDREGGGTMLRITLGR